MRAAMPSLTLGTKPHQPSGALTDSGHCHLGELALLAEAKPVVETLATGVVDLPETVHLEATPALRYHIDVALERGVAGWLDGLLPDAASKYGIAGGRPSHKVSEGTFQDVLHPALEVPIVEDLLEAKGEVRGLGYEVDGHCVKTRKAEFDGV